MGKTPENEISRSINKRMEHLGASMAKSLDYIGHAGQEYSSLLHMTTKSHGSAFVWKRVTAYSLSDFETLKIVTRKAEARDDLPTFDLVLSLSETERNSRKAMRKS